MTKWKIKSTEYVFRYTSTDDHLSLGIDPGTVHLGFALLVPHYELAYAFEVEKEREPSTEERINVMLYMISFFSAWQSVSHITIEGASYMDRYRQIELEDVRAAGVCWKKLQGSQAIFQTPSPMTIRKTVFGSGKIKNPWKEQGLPDNAAAALGCALFPIFQGEQK